MATSLRFVMDKQAQAALKAAGTDAPGGFGPTPCHLHVGDTVSFPGVKQLAYEVVHRHLIMEENGDSHWRIGIRPAHNPLLDEATYARKPV